MKKTRKKPGKNPAKNPEKRELYGSWDENYFLGLVVSCWDFEKWKKREKMKKKKQKTKKLLKKNYKYWLDFSCWD